MLEGEVVVGDELQDLARRAVACSAWRWLPGMAVTSEFWSLPDFTDALTALGVLVLVREAFSNRALTPVRSLAGYWFWSRGTARGEFKSELDALVAALEAAPVPSLSSGYQPGGPQRSP